MLSFYSAVTDVEMKTGWQNHIQEYTITKPLTREKNRLLLQMLVHTCTCFSATETSILGRHSVDAQGATGFKLELDFCE